MSKVEVELLADRQAKMTVTVEPERLQQELKAAASRIARKVNIPGFRRGKAPYHIILRYVGEDAVFEEALEPLGQSIYSEALKESSLQPYSPGSLDDISRDPLILSFTVPLMPEIDLGGYRDARIPFEVPEVSDKDVDAAIDHAREQQATHEHVDRAVVTEDVALLDIKGALLPRSDKKADKDESLPNTSEDELFLDRKGAKVLIADKATYPVPGFPAEILGMAAGETREFDIALSPKDDDIDEELRGRTIHFTVTCHEVFKRGLPDVDDEFARSLGDYENLEDLRQKVKADLEQNARNNARSAYTDKVLDHLLDGIVHVNYPPIVVDERIDDMVQDFDRQLRQQGLNLDDYLSLNKLTLEQVRSDFRESAVRQVERGLLLGKLSDAEQLAVSDEEIDDETQTRLLSFGAQAATAKPLMTSPEMRRTIASRLLTDKTLDRLMEIARGEAPPLPSGTEGEDMPTSSPTNAAGRKTASKKTKPSRQKSNKVPIE